VFDFTSLRKYFRDITSQKITFMKFASVTYDGAEVRIRELCE